VGNQPDSEIHVQHVTGRPERDEAAPYYFTYIDKVTGGDIRVLLESQLHDTLAFLAGISEERSLHRYESGKWSIREVLNHVNDAERLFLSRAFWFARGFDGPLPSFDEKISWALHVDEFKAVRASTLAFFRNLPAEAWMRRGVASGNPFSVRALAWICAGHLAHHTAVLEERYS